MDQAAFWMEQALCGPLSPPAARPGFASGGSAEQRLLEVKGPGSGVSRGLQEQKCGQEPAL